MEKGLIHIYCGEGKGKTTAAIGLGVRACGSGLRVLMVRYLKGRGSGELEAVSMLPGFSVMTGPETVKFTVQMSKEEREEYRLEAMGMLDLAIGSALRGECDMLIMDEIFPAIEEGIVEAKRVSEFLRAKPKGLEVVLTGRNPPAEILELADYISEIKKIRHPFDAGMPARRGIEF